MAETVPSSAAPAEQAAAHLRQNLAALRITQPELAESAAADPAILEYRTARDGSLSALESPRRFVGGCSVPAALADELLGTVELASPAVCYLAPTHAAEIALALRKLRHTQVLWVIWPEIEPLRLALRLCDFSEPLGQRRLWFAAGADWAGQLRHLLEAHDGLAVPAQLVRTPLLPPELGEAMTAQMRDLLGQVSEHRAARLAELRARPTTVSASTLRIVRPASFALWQDAPESLWQAAQIPGRETAPLDPDDVMCATPLAMARAIAGAEALLIADRAREDLGDVVGSETALITWLTSPRELPWSRHPRDAVLVCDQRWCAPLLKGGWPAERVRVAQWPTREQTPRPGPMVMIADTLDTDIDLERFDLSSHRLLWEMIREELLERPMALGLDAPAYLRACMRKLEIAAEGLDESFWLTRLILPAWQQGQVRALRRAGIEVRVHGAGWDDGQPVPDRNALDATLHGTAGLVLPAPVDHPHPCEALGLPVLRPMAESKWLETARAMTRGQARVIPPKQPLSAALLVELLR